MLAEVFKSLSFLSILLIVGTLLRAKIKLFQNLFLPASVIGGFIGLIIVQTSIIPIPFDWVRTYSLLPGILIIPIFASIPLGMSISKSNMLTSFPNIIKCFGIFQAVAMTQCIIGYGTNLLYSRLKPEIELYRTFGYELSAGFSGGHGLAAATGKLLEGFGVPYWEVAQGIAMTTATVGLIGGIVFGIIFINIAVRKKNTSILKEPNDIPIESKLGFNKNINSQASIGRETLMSSNIETIAFHLAIIFSVCGLAYIILDLVRKTNITGLSVLPVWTYSMIIMFILNIIIGKLKMDWIVDSKLKSRITGSLSDFAVVSAITSLPIKAVLQYIEPLIFMMILGFIVSYFMIFFMAKSLFKKNYFEYGIMLWGALTGVMITGITLLKICDNDYQSPVLKDFSLGFSINFVSSLLIVPILNSVLATGSTMMNFIVSIIFTLVYIGIAFSPKLKGL